jgi:hypothetical protein
MADVTPNCPGPDCRRPPALRIGSSQAFCDNDACEVLMWDPTKGPEQQDDAHTVNLNFDTGKQP